MPAASTIAYSVVAAASVYTAYQQEQARKKAEEAQEEQIALQEQALASQQNAQAQQEQMEQQRLDTEMADDESSAPSLKTAVQTTKSTRVRRDTLTPKGLSIPSGPPKSGLNIGYAKA